METINTCIDPVSLFTRAAMKCKDIHCDGTIEYDRAMKMRRAKAYCNTLDSIRRDPQHLTLHVPHDEMTNEMVLIAMEVGTHLGNVPDAFRSGPVCWTAINRASTHQAMDLVEYIPPQILTYEMCEELIRKNPIAFRSVPLRFKTLRMCYDVIRREPVQYFNVPTSVKADPLIHDYIARHHPEYFNYEDTGRLCMMAIAMDSRVFARGYIPTIHW